MRNRSHIPYDLIVPIASSNVAMPIADVAQLPSVSQPLDFESRVYGLLQDNFSYDATSFVRTGTITTSGTEQTIASFTVPDGMMGVVKFFGQDAKTTDAFLHTTWRILRNGTPITDFGAITFQLGTLANPKKMTERINSSELIQLTAISTGGTYEIYGLLEGWYWTI